VQMHRARNYLQKHGASLGTNSMIQQPLVAEEFS